MNPDFAAKFNFPLGNNRSAKIAAAILFSLAGSACAQSGAALPPMNGDTSAFNPKMRVLAAQQNAAFEAGVLVLAPEGDINWRHKLERVTIALRRKMPVEISLGADDLRALQPALDRLAARGVKKIIAAPAFLFTRSKKLDQSRYLLGLTERPIKSFSQSRVDNPFFRQLGGDTPTMTPRREPMAPKPARARNNIPLVMMPALDETNLPFAALAMPTTSFASIIGDPVSLVITAAGPEDEDEYRLTQSYLEMLADSLKRKYNLQNARAALLFADNSRAESGFPAMAGPMTDKLEPRQNAGERGRRSREDLRKAVMEFSRTSKTLVLGYSPDDGELDKIVEDALDGAFYRWGGTIELSEAALSAWLQNMAQAGLKLKASPMYTKPENSSKSPGLTME